MQPDKDTFSSSQGQRIESKTTAVYLGLVDLDLIISVFLPSLRLSQTNRSGSGVPVEKRKRFSPLPVGAHAQGNSRENDAIEIGIHR